MYLAGAEDFWRAFNVPQFYDVNKPKMATKMVSQIARKATEIHYLTPEVKYQDARDEIIGELAPEEIQAMLLWAGKKRRVGCDR